MNRVFYFSLFFFVFNVHADREADGIGALGVAQHAQEAGVLSAGSTWHRHREKTCKKNVLLLLALALLSELNFKLNTTLLSNHIINI